MSTQQTVLDIPSDFGSGGKGLTPNGSSTPTLKDLLVELQTVANAAAAAADAAASAASGASTLATSTLLKQEAAWYKPADDALAVDVLAEVIFYRASKAETITALSLLCGAGLTADATNKTTVTVRKRPAAGGAAVSVGTYTSDVAGGTVTAWVAKALTLTSTGADKLLAAGDILTIEITKAGTGVIIPAGIVSATLTAP